jgi:sulfur-carrier protein adenylyltransferase/sulfurtransferase
LAARVKLARARVLLVGAGGLGSPAALYLAGAGVGTLGISDGDCVELSNLHRQVLHRSAHIGLEKSISAEVALRALNPNCQVERLPAIQVDNAQSMLRSFDLVVDGSDNFATRYLVADTAVLLSKPLIYGAVLRFSGQVSVFQGHRADAPCYRCLFPRPPAPEHAPNCAQAGVLGVVPGVIGTMQALEAIKCITGIGQDLVGRVLLFDALRASWREIKLAKDPDCPGCGSKPDPERHRDYAVTACAQ